MDVLKSCQSEAADLFERSHALACPNVDEQDRPRTERQKAEELNDIVKGLAALLGLLISELIRKIGGASAESSPSA